ncbi:MAG: transposase [Candidatus Thorarchaeota archaeon]|nr:transposase [Candidatus Thorarchaeota archaeon]
MVKSQTATITVKIPINWGDMTARKRKRLDHIVGRDNRVIRAYLGIIERHEADLLWGKTKQRIDDTKLNELTLTALKVKEGTEKREWVPHDFKKRFPMISVTELAECRQTAVAHYNSYLVLREKKGRLASRPAKVSTEKRIPRWVFMPYRAKLVEQETSVANWWLDLRDSLDSVQEGRTIHDRLLIPLKTSPFHLNQLESGTPKAVQIFQDRYSKWWAAVAVRLEIEETYDPEGLPSAVLGIDLGLKKSACATLLTEHKVSETRYFVQKEKIVLMAHYDQLVADLQRDLELNRVSGAYTSGIAEKLGSLKRKRARVAKQYDRVLVRQLLDYIEDLSNRFSLYVALGDVKGIRWKARKGNYRGPHFRGMIHRWSFARISEMLSHGLLQMGWQTDGRNARFHTVPEAWTSIMCWKCGQKGQRPRQSLFVCSCGFRTNADRNGSLNIARRLITLIPSLTRDENGLGRWVTPERAPAPKAGRKIPSKRKPQLPPNGSAQGQGESAAVRFVQMDLMSFGDNANESDYGPAVARTAETLAAAGKGATRGQQETEAPSEGGTVS